MRPLHALIVGGGPAGAAAAFTLARAGLPHLLLERTRDPQDALCGGFLSWRTLAALRTLAVTPDDLNPAATTTVRLTWRDRAAEAALPQAARCVSRRRLDALLLARAAAAGANIERGVAVRSWEHGLIHTRDGATFGVDALMLATGKHDLRGLARPAGARGRDPALGLRVRLAAAPGLTRLVGDRVELHLVQGGYAGCALQEDGSANLCLAIRRSRLDAAGTPEALLLALAAEAPQLAARLAYLDGDPAIDAVANVPYGWSTVGTEPRVFRLGDQAAVIPSLAGEGMGIALASGLAAARSFANGAANVAPHFQAHLARRTRSPLRIAGLIRAAAERGWSAQALVAAVRIAPALAGVAARLTRIAN